MHGIKKEGGRGRLVTFLGHRTIPFPGITSIFDEKISNNGYADNSFSSSFASICFMFAEDGPLSNPQYAYPLNSSEDLLVDDYLV